jgi:poly(3-hydroxybutyrate) depolymerase
MAHLVRSISCGLVFLLACGDDAADAPAEAPAGENAAVPTGAQPAGDVDAAAPMSDTRPSGPLGDSLGPCTDCRVHVPASYASSRPAGLVVVLHGDEGRDIGTLAATANAIDLFRDAADARGFIVLALACPASLGCNGAWSDWLAASSYRVPDGALAWLDAQADAIEKSYAVLTSREVLAGFSGGAYWLGYAAQARANRFAGVAFVAGGMPAYAAYNGCPPCKIPGYFLGGNGDPRTAGQMSDTASAFQKCGEETKLDLVTGDHQQAIASLTTQKRAGAILDWFVARPLACR